MRLHPQLASDYAKQIDVCVQLALFGTPSISRDIVGPSAQAGALTFQLVEMAYRGWGGYGKGKGFGGFGRGGRRGAQSRGY
eukprot:173023-Lingulodinium_polyedra.AAC.1